MSTLTERIRGARKTWEARVTLAGHPPRSKTFPHNEKKKAQEWANDLEARLRRGEKVSVVPGKSLIADVVEDFLAESVERDEDGYPMIFEETDDHYSNAPFGEVPIRYVWEIPPWKLYSLRRVSESLGSLTVEQLTAPRVDEWLKILKRSKVPKQKRKEGGKAHPLYDGDSDRTYTGSAIRKLFQALKSAVEWHARRHGYAVGDRFDVELPKGWTPRNRRLKGGEEAALLAACGSTSAATDAEGWRLLIRLALATAMRAQEILGLTWDEVSDKPPFIGLPAERTKTSTARSIPLGAEARAAIAALRARRNPGDERVFWMIPSKTTIMGRVFKAITKQAGIEDLRFHDLRHEATARLFERTSMRQLEISLVTGHASPGVLKRYANLRPEFLLKQLEAPGHYETL